MFTSDPKQWEIIEYEVRMLQALRLLLNDRQYRGAFDAERNALVESACLHTRILCDCFLPTKPDKDDIWLNDLLDSVQLQALAGLRSSLETAYKIEQPVIRATLNKRIAHPSKSGRDLSYDYKSELERVFPLLMRIWNAACQLRQTPQLHVDLGTSPYFKAHAKTSS